MAGHLWLTPVTLGSRPVGANSFRDSMSKITKAAGCQWLTHVILATQEAEIRRMKTALGK
jgi:hypothetical protein